MTPKPEELIPALRRELEDVIKRVNYHYQSGYDRHVNLQKPESIFLNFLKKKVTLVPPSILFRLRSRDFYLSMSSDNYVINLTFTTVNLSYYEAMKPWVEVLNKSMLLINYDEIKEKSHTMDKFYQVTDKLINDIKDFKFG